MIATPSPERKPRAADFGADRRATVLSLLSDPAFQSAELTDDARLVYVIGALICDDTGALAESDLNAAMADPSVAQYAHTLLRKAGER